MNNLVKRKRHNTLKRAIREIVRSGLQEAFLIGTLSLKASCWGGAILGGLFGGLYAILNWSAARFLAFLLIWCLGVFGGGVVGTALGVLFGTAVGVVMGSLVVVGIGAESLLCYASSPSTALGTGAPDEVAPAAAPEGRGNEASPK